MHKNGEEERATSGSGYPALAGWFVTEYFLILLGLQLRYNRAVLLAFLVCVEASFIGSNKKPISAFPKRTDHAKGQSLFSGSHAQCCVIQKKVLSVVS